MWYLGVSSVQMFVETSWVVFMAFMALILCYSISIRYSFISKFSYVFKLVPYPRFLISFPMCSSFPICSSFPMCSSFSVCSSFPMCWSFSMCPSFPLCPKFPMCSSYPVSPSYWIIIIKSIIYTVSTKKLTLSFFINISIKSSPNLKRKVSFEICLFSAVQNCPWFWILAK